MVGKLKKIMVVIVGTFLWFSLYSQVIEQEALQSFSGPIFITHVDHQEGPFGNRFILQFNSEPICNFVPKDVKQAENAEYYFSRLSAIGRSIIQDKNDTIDLEFVFPCAQVKGKHNKNFLQQINVTKSDVYSISFEQTELPISGYICKISFKPHDVGFQLEGILNQGKPAIAFTFYRYETLKKINLAVNTICQTT